MKYYDSINFQLSKFSKSLFIINPHDSLTIPFILTNNSFNSLFLSYAFRSKKKIHWKKKEDFTEMRTSAQVTSVDKRD